MKNAFLATIFILVFLANPKNMKINVSVTHKNVQVATKTHFYLQTAFLIVKKSLIFALTFYF
jgi:hypothetical protein